MDKIIEDFAKIFLLFFEEEQRKEEKNEEVHEEAGKCSDSADDRI